MPKLKTHRGAAKRFKVTGSGKVRRRKAFKSHLQTGKGADRTFTEDGRTGRAKRNALRQARTYNLRCRHLPTESGSPLRNERRQALTL